MNVDLAVAAAIRGVRPAERNVHLVAGQQSTLPGMSPIAYLTSRSMRPSAAAESDRLPTRSTQAPIKEFLYDNLTVLSIVIELTFPYP
jgi:hypothetical protein